MGRKYRINQMMIYTTLGEEQDATQAYIDKINSYSPVAYYPLNETTGTAIVDQVSANNGTYSGVTLADTTGPAGGVAPRWDGANDYGQVTSAVIGPVFSGAEGTLMAWFKMANVGVWTDSTFRRILYLVVDGNNRIQLSKQNTNNNFLFQTNAGGTERDQAHTPYSETDWFHATITWSVTNSEMVGFIDGVEVVTENISLGTWVGTPDFFIGANDSTPTLVHNGWLAHIALWDSVVSDADILALATV